MKHISIPILLIALLFPGCSSTPQKKISIFTEKQQTELKDILDKHLTEHDWERYQQKLEKHEDTLNYELDIDIKNDYDTDPIAFELLVAIAQDKPKLQKELNDFLLRSLLSRPKMQKMIEKSRDEELKGLIK